MRTSRCTSPTACPGIVAKKGRRMMGWNEIYGHDVNGDGGGKAGTKLDTNAVIHFWKGNTDLAKNAIKDGHEVINSLHSSTYLDYSYGRISLQKAYGFEPIFPGLEEQYHSRVKGLGTQVWTEWIANTERLHHQAFPGPAPLRKWAGHLPGKRISRILKSA